MFVYITNINKKQRVAAIPPATKPEKGNLTMFYLINEKTGEWAHKDSMGEHDGKTTRNIFDAACFDDWSDASEFNQNFGPDWRIDGND